MYIASLKTINTTGTITLNLLLLLQTLLTAILHQKHRVNVFLCFSWHFLNQFDNNRKQPHMSTHLEEVKT